VIDMRCPPEARRNWHGKITIPPPSCLPTTCTTAEPRCPGSSPSVLRVGTLDSACCVPPPPGPAAPAARRLSSTAGWQDAPPEEVRDTTWNIPSSPGGHSQPCSHAVQLLRAIIYGCWADAPLQAPPRTRAPLIWPGALPHCAPRRQARGSSGVRQPVGPIDAAELRAAAYPIQHAGREPGPGRILCPDHQPKRALCSFD